LTEWDAKGISFDPHDFITRESTKRQPCQEHYASTCEDIESYQMLVEQFNCQIPFLNFGNHLRRYFQLGLKECDQKVIKKALDFFLIRNESSSCTQVPVCRKTKFKISIQEMKLNADISTFVVNYRDPEIEHQYTSISYDVLSLIGEIGGVLGLTLGLSIFSLLQVLIDKLN
jgi:hypothetical protein